MNPVQHVGANVGLLVPMLPLAAIVIVAIALLTSRRRAERTVAVVGLSLLATAAALVVVRASRPLATTAVEQVNALAVAAGEYVYPNLPQNLPPRVRFHATNRYRTDPQTQQRLQARVAIGVEPGSPLGPGRKEVVVWAPTDVNLNTPRAPATGAWQQNRMGWATRAGLVLAALLAGYLVLRGFVRHARRGQRCVGD